jgi:FkbM family methyltransferase
MQPLPRKTSQFRQDTIVLELLKQTTNGFFLDIGSSHPIDLSNTYLLEKKFNWTGLCVEPRKQMGELYKQTRNCLFELAAIYTHTGTISFSDRDVCSGINDKTITDVITRNENDIYDVPCLTFEDLFKKHNVPSLIHYMSMDVEGAELILLETFPFEQKCVLTASIEHNSHHGERQKQKGKQIIELMKSKGFELDQITGADYIFKNVRLPVYIQ